VEQGSTYVTRLAARDVSAATPEPPHPEDVLSRREYEVFLGLGSGARARDVAVTLGVSPKTVDTYRASILRKLRLDGMASLVRLAASLSRR
jgi:DNA-binding NarL/FixJ family response regulator